MLSVLFVHAPSPASTPSYLRQALRVLAGGGWIGVDLFFVLSGFLVSGLLFGEYDKYKTIRPGRFLLRRGLKIYPAFYFMLSLTLVYGALRWRDFTGRSFFAEVFFVQNYFHGVWAHTWTLAMEEHFYLLLTVTLYLLAFNGRRANLEGRATFKSLPAIYLTTAVACFVARAVTYRIATQSGAQPYFIATHLRIDELLFGVTLSYLWRYEGERMRSLLMKYRTFLGVAVAIAVPCFFVPWTTAAMATVGFVLLQLTFGTLLLLTLVRPIAISRSTSTLRRIGTASYSIYLWHVPWREASNHVIGWMGALGAAWPVALLLYFLGSVGVGILAAALIEIPILIVRDRLFPSRSGTPASISTTDGSLNNRSSCGSLATNRIH